MREDGGLDVEGLLAAFQRFCREDSEHAMAQRRRSRAETSESSANSSTLAFTTPPPDRCVETFSQLVNTRSLVIDATAPVTVVACTAKGGNAPL